MAYKPAIYKTVLLLWFYMAAGVMAYAQEKPHGQREIDSAMAISPDYLPTRYAQLPTSQYNPLVYNPIDTSLNLFYAYDPTLLPQNLYQSLGINGQAHKSMIFDIDHPLGFSMIQLPFPLYFKKLSDLKIYDLATSYTDLQVSYGLLTEFTFRANHAQRVRQVDFVFNIDGGTNEGYFIRQSINHLSLSGIVKYEMPEKIYGFLFAYAYNHGKFLENGGLEDIHSFIDRPGILFNQEVRDQSTSNNLSSYAVMLSNAQSSLNTHSGELINYVNIKDKQGHYYGTFSHTFNFDFFKSQLTDHDLNDIYYRQRYYQSTDSTNDSICYYAMANTLQWANYSPVDTVGSQPYFFRFAGGARQEFVKSFNPYYIGNHIALFARTNIRLFKVWDIYGDISYSLFGYTHNDALAHAGFRFTINKPQRNYLGLEVSFGRYSPDYIFSLYVGNNNYWDLKLKKQNVFKASAYWTIFDYSLRFNFINAGKYVYLNNNYEPQQLTKPLQVLEFLLYAPVRTKHFSIDAELALQHSTNAAVTLPLFAGKLSGIYSTRIFKKRLRFQVGIDLFYNTRYYADGYNPILHQFYTQHDLYAGNYLYVNAHLALRVKRISFFLRGSNLTAGLFNYHYMTTAGYPMQGRSLELGLNWKFYD